MNKIIAIIGLGSMGKRRIRNLQALNQTHIAGFDLRADRREEAAKLSGIPVYETFEAMVKKHQPEALIVSVPPHLHHVYMKKAIDLKLPFFVEASVVDTEMASIIRSAKASGVFAAPSSTMYFHTAIRKIFELVKGGYLGKISALLFHSGQYLPDWHPYEKVSDYYVSRRETGGAREIVPFEMTWIAKLFGFPARVAGSVRKTIPIEGAPEIDDTYTAILDYEQFTVSLTVDVVSRYGTRHLLINGADRQLVWRWDEKCVKVFHPDTQQWETFNYETLGAASGYNQNITEQMYIDEMDCFLKAIERPDLYVNTLEEDHKVLKLLYAIEESHRKNCFIEVRL